MVKKVKYNAEDIIVSADNILLRMIQRKFDEVVEMKVGKKKRYLTIFPKRWKKKEGSMKKLLVVFGILALGCTLFTSPAHALTWTKTNQATVAWDAVTTTDDGSPIPAGSTIQYRVFSKTILGVEVELGITNTTSYTLTLTDGQKIFVGVQSERIVDGVIEAVSTRKAYSNVPSDCLNGVDFGLKFFKDPANVKNLHAQ